MLPTRLIQNRHILTKLGITIWASKYADVTTLPSAHQPPPQKGVPKALAQQIPKIPTQQNPNAQTLHRLRRRHPRPARTDPGHGGQTQKPRHPHRPRRTPDGIRRLHRTAAGLGSLKTDAGSQNLTRTHQSPVRTNPHTRFQTQSGPPPYGHPILPTSLFKRSL